MDRNLKRLLNKIFITSKLKVVTYPIKDSSVFIDNTHSIDQLLSMGFISIVPYTPSASWDIIVVSDIALPYITERSKGYVNSELRNREHKKVRAERRTSVNWYKRDRDPWMGQRLTRHGSKEMCIVCNAINKPCEHTEQYKVTLPVEARPPKISASKKKWRTFKKLFNIGDR